MTKTLLKHSILTFVGVALVWGLSVAAHAGDVSKIRTVPPEIILGALDFGLAHDPTMHFKVTVKGMPTGNSLILVDCKQASGVSVVSQRNEGSDIVVELEADVKQLSAGQPYGAFIKKQVRLETDCAEQPQFVVPLVGWLDVNRSSRNFSQFVFQGKPRWQGPWPTPNVAGAFLVSCTLVLVGFTGGMVKRIRRNKNVPLFLGLGLAIVATTYLLSLLCSTYSREAWLALFLACAAMALLSVPLRIPALAAVGLFFVILFCTPSGVQRFESYSQIDADLSIANRFKLWTGALQIMADHPFAGTGVGGFSFTFERDYQPFSYTAQTSSAVNDFLTIGAEHGILFLSILLGPLLLLLAWSLFLCRKSDNLTLMVSTAIALALFTTSCFSTLWVISDYRWISVVTLGGLLWCAVINEFWKRGAKSFAFQLILQSSKWTLTTSVVLLLICHITSWWQPTRFSSQKFVETDSRFLQYDEIVPRWTKSKGTVLYLADLSKEAVLAHSTLRPMAKMGWRVIPISCSADPKSVCDLITALRESSSTRDIFVAGESKGAKLAWKIAAEESSGEIEAGGGFDFLSSDMDMPEGKGAPSQPFLVYQSLYGDGTSSNPAILARNQIAFRGLPLTVVLSEETATHFSSAWINFLTTLSDFFDHECQRR